MTELSKGGRSVFRSASIVAAFTLLSRIFGFIRDMVIANFFGAAAVADAFFIAFRIPNLLRRLTAEGALSAAFVPLFTKTLQRDREAAFRLANNLLATMAFILTIVAVVAIIFAPQIMGVIAIGFTDNAEQFAITVELTRWLFPYIIFISLASIIMGVLNSMGHFSSPAAMPVLLNLSIIIAALFLREVFSLPIYSLAVGVLVGGFLQLAVQLPFAFRLGFRLRPRIDLKSELLRKVFLLTIPATFGFAVAEINMFVDTVLASLLDQGSVSYLYYGNRLVQFPLGVFGIAMSTALLPSLSAFAGQGNKQQMITGISEAFRMILLLIIPSTVGLIMLRKPIVELLFQRGAFDVSSTEGTCITLAFYCSGLFAFAGVKIFVSGFYAEGDTKTPVKVAALAMLINIGLNLLLMEPLKAGGLALATSLSSACNLLMLIFILRSRLGGIDGFHIIRTTMLLLFGGAVMGGYIYASWSVVFHHGYDVPALVTMISSAAFIYLVTLYAMRLEEMKRFISFAKQKLGR